ncbi:MAG: UDP-N-acetylmuramoyl-L-alanine--D-glutamate ligase, partial [bacterium]|nr:UDP-N-acetylmuramoyl-L-alanine--D-glutamate ligase [bacterium]
MNLNLSDGTGRAAGVVGMGRSGYAAARLLSSNGFTVTGFDNSISANSSKHISRSCFREYCDPDLSGLSVLVLSPGVPLTAAISRRASELNVPVIGEVELALHNTNADIIAVTGSNGKTTTVEWLTHVLRSTDNSHTAVAAGNMGYALCDAILDHPECTLFVVELSSYQLETTTSLKAKVAVILNLTPDHLARHGTME